jgi:hypothetical protein
VPDPLRRRWFSKETTFEKKPAACFVLASFFVHVGWAWGGSLSERRAVWWVNLILKERPRGAHAGLRVCSMTAII